MTRFDIVGSTIKCSIDYVPSDIVSTGTLSLLQDTEGNHCSSFPAALLQLICSGAQLLSSSSSSALDQYDAYSLLLAAQSFNPLAWASEVQRRSPATDLPLRAHVASAHQAATCIYLSRVILSRDSTVHISHDLEHLVAEIIHHLSFVRPDSALFPATTWPAFVAGAETIDHPRQSWVAKRFQELWTVQPWGLIRGALGVLESIWSERRSGVAAGSEGTLVKAKGDWVNNLKGREVDWLIL